MRCYCCGNISWDILCRACQKEFFPINIKKRDIGRLSIMSFYDYSTLESLLLTKYKAEGHRIYKALAKMTLKPFIEAFVGSDTRMIYILGIDEVIKNGYAHIAVLTREMKTKTSLPLHALLIARNRVRYAGQDLAFRLDNPRDFVYKGKSNIDVILVDDIVTTGNTLYEAYEVLNDNGVNVLFALVLADVLER